MKKFLAICILAVLLAALFAGCGSTATPAAEDIESLPAVQMIELNNHLAAPGTRAKMEQTVENFRRGKKDVFKGNYTGVDPDYPTDTIDLTYGFEENKNSSIPSFHYVLDDCVICENEEEESIE